MDFSQPELAGRISSLSTDVFPGRNTPDRGSRHGTRVATVIAANSDGSGTVGVAYKATILSIRADNSAGACATEGCSFADRELAAAIDYAIASGARVINLSIGGPTPHNLAFEAALQRAVSAGLVVTASAGNDGSASPEWPARYAVDPRYRGAVMAVGASAQDGSLAGFSGLAGVAANGYLVAPGEDIVTDCTASGCWRVSGTSFSSPIVAGAVALLLEAFPMLSGRDAVDILFRTATDMGEPGVDAVWGRGLLNLRAAFRPVGALSVPAPSGTSFAPVAAPGSQLGPAFGDALGQTTALNTFGRDDYRRIYLVDLSKVLPQGDGGLIGVAAPATRASSVALAGPAGVKLALQAEQPVFSQVADSARIASFAAPRHPSSVQISAELGRLALTVWRGEGGARPPGLGQRDAFRTIATPDDLMQADLRLTDGWTLSAEHGRSEREDLLASQTVEATRYAAAIIRYERGDLAASLTAGAMDEPRGPLGSDVSGKTPFGLPSRTRFGAASLAVRPSNRLTLRGEIAWGRTEIEQGFLETNGAFSSHWRVGAYGDCGRFSSICDRFSLELEQPLRIERGRFSVLLADVPTDWRDPTTFSTRRFDASPTGRQLDLRVTMDRDLGDWGFLRLRTVMALEEGHRAEAEPGLGAALDWRLSF